MNTTITFIIPSSSEIIINISSLNNNRKKEEKCTHCNNNINDNDSMIKNVCLDCVEKNLIQNICIHCNEEINENSPLRSICLDCLQIYDVSEYKELYRNGF